MKKDFSLFSILASALVSLITGSIAGAFVENYLNRPKLSLATSSVGFSGEQELMEVPDSLRETASCDRWGEALSKFESFETLLNREKSTAEYIKRLDYAMNDAIEWLEKYGAEDTLQFNASQLKTHPFMNKDVFRTLLTDLIHRDELSTLPVQVVHYSLSEESEDYHSLYPSVFSIFEDDGPVHGSYGSGLDLNPERAHLFEIDLKASRVNFICKDKQSAHRLALSREVAYSFGTGLKQNVVALTHVFRERANMDILCLKRLQEEAQPLLMKSSRLSLAAVAVNSGMRDITIKPHMGLKINHQQFENKMFPLGVHAVFEGKAAELATTSDINPDILTCKPCKGSDVYIEPFLPRAVPGSYVTVPAGKSVVIYMIGTDPLDRYGELIKNIYETDLLKCQIWALDTEGDRHSSGETAFGASIREQQQKELLNAVEAANN